MVFSLLQLCETYSQHLYFPATADKSVVQGSAKFRSKGRLPALSYYYAHKKVGDNHSIIYIYIHVHAIAVITLATR